MTAVRTQTGTRQPTRFLPASAPQEDAAEEGAEVPGVLQLGGDDLQLNSDPITYNP